LLHSPPAHLLPSPPATQVAQEFKHRVTPSHASAVKQEVRVELYSSDEPNPTFVSERMVLVETIVLPLDMTRVTHEDAYHIDLSFRFGAAEIEVRGPGVQGEGLGCRSSGIPQG
jgi:hypothetical protein